GYEADKWDILVVDVKPDGTFAGKPQNLTEKKDVSVNEFCWAGEQMTFTADVAGTVSYHTIKSDGTIQLGIWYGGGGGGGSDSVSSLSCSTDGTFWTYVRSYNWLPPEISVSGFPLRGDGGR